MEHQQTPQTQEADEDYRCIVYQPGDVSPCRYPSLKGKRRGKKRNGELVKEAAKKKLKLQPEGKRQTTIDEWLSKFIPVKCMHVHFSYKVNVRHITSKGTLSVKSYKTLLVDEEETVKRQTVFQQKRLHGKAKMRLKHKIRRQEISPRRVRLITHIVETLHRVNV